MGPPTRTSPGSRTSVGVAAMSANDDRVADVFDTAMSYVAARIANEAAEPGDMLASVTRVDAAWSELVAASGLKKLGEE